MDNPNLTAADQRTIEEAWARANPSIFLNHFLRPSEGGFYVYPGSVRHTQYLRHWLRDKPDSFVAESAEIRFEVAPKVGDYSEHLKGVEEADVPPGYDLAAAGKVAFFEKRGHILLPWVLQEFRQPQTRLITIGTPGVGKTLNRGFVGIFRCSTTPFFRFLNVAPTVYQSNVMIRELRQRVIGTSFEKKFLLPGKAGYHAKPYAMYGYTNEATMEFMNIAKNADNIQGWRGDQINFDEAGLANGDNDVGGVELADMLPGLVSRMTGERPDGKPRSGILSLISMAYDNDALWQLYDYGLLPETQNQYFSMLVTKDANPYITPKQWKAIVDDVRRNVPIGMQESWLSGIRPSKQGAEFPGGLVTELFSETQATEGRALLSTVIEEGRFGITTWEEAYRPGHVYVAVGDPGMGDPPFRNAPCIQVWDVTRFPYEKARLVAFWWGFGNGSITPFLNKFDQYISQYHVPENCRGYDSTGPQKFMAETAWGTGEKAVIPLGFEAGKKWQYINAAKILMSKSLLQAPAGLTGFEKQLRDYRLPDKKLAQDTVSTFCMACALMEPLYREAYPDNYEEDQDNSGDLAALAGRNIRPAANRASNRSRR